MWFPPFLLKVAEPAAVVDRALVLMNGASQLSEQLAPVRGQRPRQRIKAAAGLALSATQRAEVVEQMRVLAILSSAKRSLPRCARMCVFMRGSLVSVLGWLREFVRGGSSLCGRLV